MAKTKQIPAEKLEELVQRLSGELYHDTLLRTIYATDASVYRELPLAVAYPKTVADIQQLVRFAHQYHTSLIPRTAGTSLAGQCVGEGIVVDVSKYFNQILELNTTEGWVRVQPGVIRDELNAFLRPHGLFFGPNTSTANRAMLGGMVGNNSCGTTSIVYGNTRDHVIELETVLSDGQQVLFGPLSATAFAEKKNLNSLEGQLYRQIEAALSPPEIQTTIKEKFPKAAIQRRNTGYAVDALLAMTPFTRQGTDFNFCALLCGSEGTLAFTTAVKLQLDPLPQPADVVLAAHFPSVHDSLLATRIAMQHQPTACELMDKIILDCTKTNIEQKKNRFFIEGDPAAILMIEFRGQNTRDAQRQAEHLVTVLQQAELGYAYPIVHAPQTQAVWALRSAGLGLLANIPGDKKAVACIEDTVVTVADLPAYIAEFSDIMQGFGQRSVYYAHAGAGEIHLRPILDLKKSEDVQQFYDISEASARLVKKYRGSLSGEHGDGRVRAPFIPLVLGDDIYALLRDIKKSWDPQGIFNPGKIVDAPPMTTALRYEPDVPVPDIATIFDFSDSGGILRLAEKCNGSGDCRKLPFSGGTMCPSYQATRNEKDTTRARANTLREFLTQNQKSNPFDHPEIKEVLDLCLSCKGCTSECPSNVDMSTLKAEFQHQYYRTHGVPLRAKAFANVHRLNQWAGQMAHFSNTLLTHKWSSYLLKKALGIAPQRSLPTIAKESLRTWFTRTAQKADNGTEINRGTIYRMLPYTLPPKKTVYLFCDEFTDYNDAHIGIQSVELLTALGYEVRLIDHPPSGRAHLSKGLLKEAQQLAQKNVAIFASIISEETPLIGIEPSAILGFRDEYPRLVKKDDQQQARELAKNSLLIDEFLAQEIKQGHIKADPFSTQPKSILLHGHCHQKALSSVADTAWLLSLPANYSVEIIPSGCCGMAGSFGYEAEHFALSMQIGELVLFPAVRAAHPETLIVAPGTSCRHQIWDGCSRKVLHPIEVLWEALQETDVRGQVPAPSNP